MSVVGATPEGMDHHILLSVKITLNAKINMFSAFLCHHIDSSVFHEVARRWLYLAPLPESATVMGP